MNPKIWLSSPHMGNNELKYIHEAFELNWIAPIGPNINAFEKNIEEYLSEPVHVAALSSGTSALHLALIILGVKAGDEVLCQSFTFSATANPIVYLGASPVFIDSEPHTWNMCPVQLEIAIKDRLSRGKKPAAIIPVHLYGMPANMSEIMRISRLYDIPVIEDAAEALGSTHFGQKTATFGEMACLSFNGNKIITTSGGGAFVSKNPVYTERAKYLSTQARDAAPHYQHSEIGYNYRMSNISAGIGRGQMEVLDVRIEQRRSNYRFYLAAFAGVAGISLLEEPEGYMSNRWLTCILVDPERTGGITRETIRLALEEDAIESRPLWKPMHLQPVFCGYPSFLNGVSEKLFEQGLCLPSGSNLSIQDLERIQQKILSVLKVH